MAFKSDFISDISAVKESWSLVAKVVRIWHVPDFNNQRLPLSMEIVLMDAKGDKIQASVRRSLIYRFQKDLKEGCVYSMSHLGLATNSGGFRASRHAYKLNFQFGTKVSPADDGIVNGSIFTFVPIAEIFGTSYDRDFLVDVMGMLRFVGTEREYERNGEMTKMNVIHLETEGFKYECALFGCYVDDLNSFRASGGNNDAVVIVQFAKVKTFQGKTVLSSAMNTTKLFFNPSFAEAVDFRNRVAANSETPYKVLSQVPDSSRASPLQEFLSLTPRISIQGLKECKEPCCFVVLATVKHVLDEDWWYPGCSCYKAVYPDYKMFFCGGCNKHVLNVIPRYCIKVRVVDETDSATFAIFDRDAVSLLNKSCADMVESVQMGSATSPVPKEFSIFVDKAFLFKVEVKKASNVRFQPSYRVMKLCSDGSILQKFRELATPSVCGVADNTSPDGTNLCFTDHVSNGCVAQDLMAKFSNIATENEVTGGDKDHIDLSKDSDEVSLGKRNCPEEDFGSAASVSAKLLKKDIKVEKE